MRLSCYAERAARLLDNPPLRLVPASPSTGPAHWIFFDAAGNPGASALVCDHEHEDKGEPRRPKVLAVVVVVINQD